MREEGNLLIFDYPGGQITFHKDLKKYYNIRNELWEERDKEKDTIDAKDEPAEIQRKFSIRLLDYIQRNLIAPLASYGLYDVTTDDFLVENPGYHDLLLATQKHYEYAIALENAMTSAAAKDKNQAAEIASQSITGMGFGVISNDWVAHALYAAQSKSVMDKQVAEAQARYNRMAATIDSTTRVATDKGIEKYKTDTYLPAVRKSIDAIFEYVLSKYCDFLSKAGQFDRKCLNGIDESRSNSVLSNLDVVTDKEKIVYQAVQLCPYNLDTYKTLFKLKLPYNDLHLEILDYFELTKVLCEWLVDQFGPSDCNFRYKTAADYQNYTRLIKSVALLRQLDQNLVASDIFGAKFRTAILPYIKLGLPLRYHRPIHSELSDYERIGVEKFSDFLKTQLKETHLPSEAIDFFKSFGLDTFERLSDAFGTEISSFEDADKIILTAWESEKNHVYEEIRQKRHHAIDKQLDELKRRKGGIQKQLEECKKKHKGIRIRLSVSNIVTGVIVFAIGIGLALSPFLIGIFSGDGAFSAFEIFIFEDFDLMMTFSLVAPMAVGGLLIYALVTSFDFGLFSTHKTIKALKAQLFSLDEQIRELEQKKNDDSQSGNIKSASPSSKEQRDKHKNTNSKKDATKASAWDRITLRWGKLNAEKQAALDGESEITYWVYMEKETGKFCIEKCEVIEALDISAHNIELFCGKSSKTAGIPLKITVRDGKVYSTTWDDFGILA